jgi:NAD-dependent SIR2 family protein deacetylase
MNLSTATYRWNLNSASHFTNYENAIAFEENTFSTIKFFFSKYPPDNIKIDIVETQHYIRCWNIAVQFNVRKDIVFYSQYLPDKTINQKIKKHLSKYGLIVLIKCIQAIASNSYLKKIHRVMTKEEYLFF